MTIGAEDLLRAYGNRMTIAKKAILGELDWDCFVEELVGPTLIAAAKASIELDCQKGCPNCDSRPKSVRRAKT